MFFLLMECFGHFLFLDWMIVTNFKRRRDVLTWIWTPPKLRDISWLFLKGISCKSSNEFRRCAAGRDRLDRRRWLPLPGVLRDFAEEPRATENFIEEKELCYGKQKHETKKHTWWARIMWSNMKNTFSKELIMYPSKIRCSSMFFWVHHGIP